MTDITANSSHTSDQDMASATFRALGAQVQRLRRQHDWTLKELGNRCDLSHAFLSQVERGKTTASVVTIQRIAAALGTTVSFLLATPQEESTVQVFRSSTGSLLQYADQVEDAEVHPLGHSGLPVKALEYIGGPSEFGQIFQHPGYEFLYVIHGSIELDVNGEKTRLDAYDAASYPGTSAHRWRSIGRDKPRVLLVVNNNDSAAP